MSYIPHPAEEFGFGFQFIKKFKSKWRLELNKLREASVIYSNFSSPTDIISFSLSNA